MRLPSSCVADFKQTQPSVLRQTLMTQIFCEKIKYLTRIGTWNVQTMYHTGKVYQIAKELQRLRLLAVSETRWTGTGKVIVTTGETVLYCGLAGDDASHKKGVALILSKEAGKSLKEWEPISERVISASFESKWQNTTILQAYAPMNDAEEEKKEDFTTKTRLPSTISGAYMDIPR